MQKINPVVVITLCLFFTATGTARSETLAEAITHMLTAHPEIRAQAYNRRARDQQVVQAKSGYYPTLDVIAGAGVAEYQEPVRKSLTPIEAAVSLRQNIFSGFTTKNEITRQKAQVDSSAYALQAISENLALRACRAYLNVLRKQELKKLAEENLTSHLRIMDQIKLRSESGVSSQVDTNQVKSRVSLAQSNVVIAETNLLDAYTNYQAVIGHPPDALSLPPSPADRLPATLEEAEHAALANHPTLKSALADLRARQKQYEVAKAPYYPIVDLHVTQRWQDDADGFDGRQQDLTVMAEVSYNLFGGFSDSGRKAETLELINEAREIKNNTERQVLESIRLSWRAYRSVLNRIDYLEEHIQSSTLTADAYSKQFDIGKRTLLDVLDTEAEAINAKIDMIEARFDGILAQYRILNGLGDLVHSFGLSRPEESLALWNKELATTH